MVSVAKENITDLECLVEMDDGGHSPCAWDVFERDGLCECVPLCALELCIGTALTIQFDYDSHGNDSIQLRLIL